MRYSDNWPDTPKEADDDAAVIGTVGGIIVTIIALSLFALLYYAEGQTDGSCISVVEQRHEGPGADWGQLPDICVPREGLKATLIDRGTHYRVKSDETVCQYTVTVGGLATSGRQLGPPRRGAYQYWSFIMGGYRTGFLPGPCHEHGIPQCIVICGEPHLR